MDKGMFSTEVFINFKTTFDKVDQEILIAMLYRYGIGGIIIEWFSSYLKGRCQVTQNGEHVSPKELNPCGVPKGSVLGSLLFLIHINDIHKSSVKWKIFFLRTTPFSYLLTNFLKVLEEVVNSELFQFQNG